MLAYLSTTPLSTPIVPKLLLWKFILSLKISSNNIKTTLIVKIVKKWTNLSKFLIHISNKDYVIDLFKYYNRLISHSLLPTKYPKQSSSL